MFQLWSGGPHVTFPRLRGGIEVAGKPPRISTKRENMKTTKLNAVVSACTCILLLGGSSQAGSDVPFKARFHGFAEPPAPTNEQNVFEIVVPLHGVGTHLGQFDERLVHLLNFATGAFTGYADWTAANGDTFK